MASDLETTFVMLLLSFLWHTREREDSKTEIVPKRFYGSVEWLSNIDQTCPKNYNYELIFGIFR